MDQEVWIATMELLTGYKKQLFLYMSMWSVLLDDFRKYFLTKMNFFSCEWKKENSSYTIVASAHRTCTPPSSVESCFN